MTKLELLKDALALYTQEAKEGSIKNPGMCWCIKTVANRCKSREEQSNKGHVPYNSIKIQIPEFNPRYLKAHNVKYLDTNLNEGLEFWWDVELTLPRIRAFKILIDVYQDNKEEFIW